MVREDGEEHTFPLHRVAQLLDGDCSCQILALGAAGTWVGSGAIVAPLTRGSGSGTPDTTRILHRYGDRLG